MLRAIGVTYGYGTEVELASVHADCICHSPADVAAYSRGDVPGQ
jgi:phosphoglycolate phosphatase-like HAD superfamily hydrolase